MFIGHFGIGFGAKKADTKVSLGTYIMASQFIDLLWPIFLLLKLEAVQIEPGNTVVTPLNFIYYPFSHSMLGVLFWSLLFGGIYYMLKKNLKGSLILGALVFSHWLLDLLTHAPDLPLSPWSDFKMGFGLWNSFAGTVIVEVLIFGLGTFFLTTTLRFNKIKGKIALWGLIGFLSFIYVMNLFGPPPPSVEPIGYIGLAQWIFVAWGYWIDKLAIN
jgi:hypothetical protein